MNDERTTAKYTVGSDLADLWITWRQSNRVLVPFGSQPYTFTLVLADRQTPDVTALTKTTGFTGFDSDPNLVVQWATSGELNALTAGVYLGQITAKRTADNRERVMDLTVILGRRIGVPV